MADFIERAGDSELLAEANQFYSTIGGSPAAYGLSAAQATNLQTAIAELQSEYDSHVTKQAAAKSQTQLKEEKRDALQKILRELVRLIKAQSDLQESSFSALGKIAAGGDYAPLSNPTRPVGNVDTSKRLRHTVSFADEATPEQKRKPAGTIGCEIWAKIGGNPPADAKECSFIALDTTTPYVLEFDGADAGKMIHYMLRWQSKDGTYSSWSETISATVTG